MGIRTSALMLVAALMFSPAMLAQEHAVSGQAILKLTQQYVDAAPKRYIGSPGHDAAEAFIK